MRDENRPAVERHYEWLGKIAEAAALATQTTRKITLITGVHEYNLNRPLQEAMKKNLDLVGAPAWGDPEQTFRARASRLLEAVPRRASPPASSRSRPVCDAVKGGSTDSAEVSHLTPTVALIVATAGMDLPWHSWATAASHGLPGASRGAVVAAKVLAATGIDLLTDPQLLSRAQATFKQKSGGQPYRPTIPPGQKPPLPEPPR